jgi:photosystem II stability/assembly factor-like uncharacterized protein
MGTAFFASGCSTVIPFQPNVPEGGRAVAIAVDPVNAQDILVASESGGLFSSKDGGNAWKHVDSLPNFGVNDVAYAPAAAARHLVLATAFEDFTVNNNGFIWRSTDGGRTWSQPAGSIPPPNPPSCPVRPHAYSVSFEPDTANVYVGTDCGLAASNDGGATWKPMISVYPLAHKVFDVLSVPGGRIYVMTDHGFFSSTDAGQSWTPSPGRALGFQGSNHSLAASPINANNIFFTGGNFELFVNTDAAHQAWAAIPGPGAPSFASRAPFLRAARTNSGSQFDLYFGNGNGNPTGTCLFRQTFTDRDRAPTAQGGALTSWVSSGDNVQHMAYIDTRGHIIELYMPVGQPPWRGYADVHDQAGAPLAQGGALTSWVSSGDNVQHLVYIDRRGHIIELYMPVGQPPWRPYADVHDQTGAPTAQGGALTSWVSSGDNLQQEI